MAWDKVAGFPAPAAHSIRAAEGTASSGFMIDAHGPRFGYAFAALCGAASAATCLAGLDRLRPVNGPAPAGS